MKKTLGSLVVLIGIIIFTPIMPLAINLLVPELEIIGTAGNLVTGYKFKKITFHDFTANDIRIYGLKLTASNGKIYNIPVKDIIINYMNTKTYVSANLLDAKLSGILTNDEHLKFSGKWQKSNIQSQNILVALSPSFITIKSNGSLGEININKKTSDYALNIAIKDFNANAILRKHGAKNLITGSGKIFYGKNKSGNIILHDSTGNVISLSMQKTANLEFDMPHANAWLPSKLKSLSGNIQAKLDGNINTADINAELSGKQHLNLKIHGNHAKANFSFDKHEVIAIADYKPVVSHPTFRQIKVMFNKLKSRVLTNASKPVKSIKYSEIKLKIYDKENLPEFNISSLIKFNPHYPDQTIVSAQSNDFNYKHHAHNIKNAHLKLKSSSERTNLLIAGLYNNKDFYARLNVGKDWYLKIDADQLYTPFSPNTTLIISPHLTINKKQDLFYISGVTDIYGGLIQTNSNDNIIDMPENVIISGKKTKADLPNLFENFIGSIDLKTISPIRVENLAGLNGNLVGSLTVSLAKNSKPKYNGSVHLLQPSYKNNKHISVIYARATYENNAIDNPFLHIKLFRAISQPSFDLNSLATIHKKQKVGLKIHGSVAEPNIITYSSNPNLSKLQIISALETGSTSGISPEQGMLSLFSMINNNENKNISSPLESIQDALNLDEIYISSNSGANHDSNNLINPNLGEASIVLTKTILENVKASYISSLHNRDYLVNISYPLSENINVNLYSSHTSQPNLSRNFENYGLNILMYNARN